MCSEPLAACLWAVALTVLIAWPLFSCIYHERGAKQRGDEWKRAIKWANEKLDVDYAAYEGAEERLAKERVQARQILRGETRWTI